MKQRFVIALGGNALGNTPSEQLELVKETAKTIVDLIAEGHDIIIGHGNGPQVGMINLAMDFAHQHGANTPLMPFAECGAMSQGYIGYHLQQAIQQECKVRNITKDIVSLVTQVEVDSNDFAFQHPTKPIGSFYTVEQANILSQENDFQFVEDAGRGYRRVVPSPKPVKIVELNTIQKLVDQGIVVITVGGGGIPVVSTEYGYKGVDAVIDKDKSCAKLALDLNADVFIVLTAVDQVSIHYNQSNQVDLKEMTVSEAKQYCKQGEFAPGSMLPKIEACIEFVEQSNHKTALITSLKKAKLALKNQTGTIIHS